MTIDPSGLPTEYADAMATVISIYAIAVFGTMALAASLLGIARVMEWARTRRAARSGPNDDVTS